MHIIIPELNKAHHRTLTRTQFAHWEKTQNDNYNAKPSDTNTDTANFVTIHNLV